MNEMVRTEKARNVEHAKGGFARRAETWSSVLICCERLRGSTRHTLPKNAARLREKFNAYKREGYGVLVSGNLGNSAGYPPHRKSRRRPAAKAPAEQSSRFTPTASSSMSYNRQCSGGAARAENRFRRPCPRCTATSTTLR